MKKLLLTFVIIATSLGFVKAQAPNISIRSFSPEMITVEEETEITITLINEGDVATTGDTKVTISSDNQYVTIIEGSAVYGPMDVNGTQEGSFKIKVNQMIPDNSKIHFNLEAVLEGFDIASDVYYDFENGIGGWTSIDADGDGFEWIESGVKLGPSYGHESEYCMFSQSYDNTFDVLYPDNYLVSPEKFKIAKDASLSFWACAQDKYYPYEHFGVAISTTGNTSASDFTMIAEWTLDSVAPTRVQGEWGKFSVDLSEYEGQEIWVAIRHFDCYDQYYMALDDVEFNNVYQPMTFDKRFSLGVFSPIPNIVFDSYKCDKITAGASFDIDITLINKGSGATTYNSKVTLSSNDNYVTVTKGDATIEPLAFNQTATKTFSFSTDGDMPEDHVITFDIQVEPNEVYEENVDYTYQFEKDLNGWTTLDANNDGHIWYHSSGYDVHDVAPIPSHSGHGHIMSESACNALLAGFKPDDYIITPNKIGVKENTTFSFYACAQDEDYIGERFGVAVSTDGNTSPYEFITIKQWILGTSQRAGEWIKYSVDLSEYAGQFAWVAIRHFNCENIFVINVDDVNISNYARCHNWNSSFSVNDGSSLDEKHDLLKIFPNPVTDKLSIKTDDALKEISIFDVSGKLVYKTGNDINNMNGDYVIDLADFNNGVYFIKIKSDKNEIIKKIVKN